MEKAARMAAFSGFHSIDPEYQVTRSIAPTLLGLDGW
jgi:hypothetical protein